MTQFDAVLWLRRVRACVLARHARRNELAPRVDPDAERLERLCRDIDASMSDMQLITWPDAGPSILMPRRLKQLGLDAAYIEQSEPATYLRLRATCDVCGNWRRCARNLAQGAATESFARYCPNSSLFDQLVIERVSGRSAPQ